jgi:hypothetical protein
MLGAVCGVDGVEGCCCGARCDPPIIPPIPPEPPIIAIIWQHGQPACRCPGCDGDRVSSIGSVTAGRIIPHMPPAAEVALDVEPVV